MSDDEERLLGDTPGLTLGDNSAHDANAHNISATTPLISETLSSTAKMPIPGISFLQLQSNMEKIANSMETMSSAWKTIALDRDKTLEKDESNTREARLSGLKRSHYISDSDNDQIGAKRAKHAQSNVSDTDNNTDDCDESGECDDESDAETLISKASSKSKGNKDEVQPTNSKLTAMADAALEFELNEKGPKVDESVAKTINSKWLEQMPIKVLNNKRAKYSVPENCENLMVPRVNKPIWNTLDRAHKTRDLKFSHMQTTCVAAGAAITKSLHDLVTSDNIEVGSLIRQLTDAVVLVGQVNYDLSLKRRENMRPALSGEYRDLCNPDHPMTKYLFGDDLHQGMKIAKETQKLGKDLQQKGYKKSFKSKGYRKHGKQGNFQKGKNFKRRNKKQFHRPKQSKSDSDN